MLVLENFKNIPRSPYGGATGLKCNFFSSNLQRSPWREKKGDLSPPQRATGSCRPPLRRQAPVARWGGDRVLCFNLPNIEFHKIPPASEDLL